MNWTTKEIEYLEGHSGEGAEAVAEALGRSVQSVKSQAKRLGVSLRRSWQCPKCGMRVHAPLSPSTGWCQPCTLEHRNGRLAEQVREMQEEARKTERLNRERQRLYSAKHRARKKLEKS